MAIDETSAPAPETETDKPDFSALATDWRISRARRDLAIAEAGKLKDDTAYDAAISAANQAHETTAAAIYEAMLGVHARHATVYDCEAMLRLALDIIEDERGERLDEALPLIRRASKCLCWLVPPQGAQS